MPPPRAVVSATPTVERTATAPPAAATPTPRLTDERAVRAGDVLDAAGAARPHAARRRDARRCASAVEGRRGPVFLVLSGGPGQPGVPFLERARKWLGPVGEPGPDGGDRPARHGRGRAALSRAAGADGRLGPDAADARGGDGLRARDRARAALLQHRRHGRGPRGAADRAEGRQAHARRHLLRVLRRAALRARPPGPRARPGARLGRPGRERQPALRGPDQGHAARARRGRRPRTWPRSSARSATARRCSTC